MVFTHLHSAVPSHNTQNLAINTSTSRSFSFSPSSSLGASCSASSFLAPSLPPNLAFAFIITTFSGNRSNAMGAQSSSRSW